MEFEKHVKIRQEKFGAVVFETLREKIFVTNKISAEILGLLAQHKESEDIVAELSKNYTGEPDVIKKDVEEFFLSLRNNGILKKDN